MQKTYYDPADLKKFGKISDWNEELGTKFPPVSNDMIGLRIKITYVITTQIKPIIYH